jgi:peroxiredoxin family protein
MATSSESVQAQGRDLIDMESRIERLEREIRLLRDEAPRTDKATLLIFSGELDKVLAGLIIATTAASLGMEVTAFFTFWGINVLKKKRVLQGKGIMEKMIDVMTPAGPQGMGVSQMNMLGAGAAMLKMMMKDKDVVSADELLELAKEAEVKLIACSMTMQVMGIREAELMEGIEVAGAASYLQDASRSSVTLFI